MRCKRCGHEAAETDKFCAECGLFLRDAFIDARLVHALVQESEGNHRDARRELERVVEAEPDRVLANHLLAQIHRSRGDDAKAEKLLERARQFGQTRVS